MVVGAAVSGGATAAVGGSGSVLDANVRKRLLRELGD